MSAHENSRLPATVRAAEERLLVAEPAEDGVRPAPGAGEPKRSAVVATQPGVLTPLQRVELLLKFPRAGLCLAQIRLRLRVLRLKVAVLGFLFRQLGLDEPKVLAKDRRTAVLGDQSLQRCEKRIQDHGVLASRMGGVK